MTLIIKFKVRSLNTSVEGIHLSLAAAPELQMLPAEVSEVKNDVAKFGARLTELEAKVKDKEVQMRSSEDQVKQVSEDSISLERELEFVLVLSAAVHSLIALPPLFCLFSVGGTVPTDAPKGVSA